MKAYVICLFCFTLLPQLSQGQFSNDYKTISEKQVPIDSSKVDKYYSNGQLKRSRLFYMYESDRYTYQVPYGTWVTYYRDGQLSSKTQYNNYGHIISWQRFAADGTIEWQYHLNHMDSKATNTDDFFYSNKSFNSEIFEQKYSFSNTSCEWYLKTEGTRINDKKSGIWKTYNFDGTVKKEKAYSSSHR